MKFEKCNEPSQTPFGVYNIDKDYIKALKKADDNVLDPEINNRYCGPVYHAICERGPMDFFVPVAINFDNANMILVCFQDGIFAEYFDFKKMIPCVDTRFLELNNSNTDLIQFCDKNKDALEHYAEFVIDATKKKS